MGADIPMQFGGQTIGEALDRICSLFGLRYRIDTDGTIILESGPKALKDLVQKVYWLKPGAIPATPSVKEILTGKGLTFPPNASVEWRANGAQLSMTNNAANQEKLAEVLNADFGGIVGSPTHWLQLTNGARLALAVDRFEKGFILGHHPTLWTLQSRHLRCLCHPHIRAGTEHRDEVGRGLAPGLCARAGAARNGRREFARTRKRRPRRSSSPCSPAAISISARKREKSSCSISGPPGAARA